MRRNLRENWLADAGLILMTPGKAEPVRVTVVIVATSPISSRQEEALRSSHSGNNEEPGVLGRQGY